MTDGEILNFFAYIKKEDGEKMVKRIPLVRKLQHNLSASFKEIRFQYMPEDKNNIFKFDDNIHYKPDRDELFFIEHFKLPEDIINAIKNPVDVDNISESDYENIKAIFCVRQMSNGEHEIIFTTFDSRKIIKSTRWKTIILYSSGIFTDVENKMIVIEEKIDVLYSNNKLYFHSFTKAKKIFGDMLNQYYREATEEEIKEFSKQLFDSEIPEDFVDYKSRELIFGIMKTGIPKIRQVVSVGRGKFGLKLKTADDGKLKVPETKQDFKRLLKLLNDDLLESPLTNVKYETNSKRRIS